MLWVGLSPEKTHSSPAPKSATGNRVFADLMSYVRMRSWWGRVGTQCNDWCPYKGNLDTQGEKCGDGGDIAVVPVRAKEHQGQTAASHQKRGEA